MSNITSIKDLLGKRWRLKETMYKNEVMVSNHSVYISSYGSNKNLFTYYYGNQQFISTTSFMVGENTILTFTGENVYNFYYKTYYGDYGNRPRIIEFNPELTEEDIIVNGYINGAGKTAEQIFVEWWNYNTEEIVEKTYVGVLSVIPTASVNIRQNGTYDVSKFAIAHINVPIPEGYLKPEGTIEISSTDEIDVTNYSKAKIVDENLKPENIAEDQVVLGIKGTFRGGIDTTDATATSDDILAGKTAYSKGEKLVGTIEIYEFDFSIGVESGLSTEEIEALNNIQVVLTDELIVSFDETILDISFSVENNELIVYNNMEEVTFNINNNKELEVIY